MRITYRGDYALKAILDLAASYNKGVVTIHELAKHIDAPIKFLEQVLLDLKQGGFVESKRGKIGGYQLARSPYAITLGEVVRFIEGATAPIACVEKGYSGCLQKHSCVLKPVWEQVDQAISRIVDQVNFGELAQRLCARQETIAYSI